MKRIFSICLFVLLFLASNCFAVTFRYIEVVSDNRQSEWRFSTDIMLNPAYLDSYDTSFSFEKGNITTTGSLNHLLFGTNHIYDSGAIGEEPSYYAGLVFSWDVKDGTDSISATGTIPSSAKKIALSEYIAISGNPIHPTVSWTNSDYSGLQQYRLRVVLADEPTKLLWETSILPSPSIAYTIYGFSFQPDVPYLIRIEARQGNLFFPVNMADSADMLTGGPRAVFLNRSTVFVPYEYPAPEPTEDVYIDPQTGLEWLAMYKTVGKSPDSIMNGPDGDGLAAQGWVHATIPQIKTLFKNAYLIEPIEGFTSQNFVAANSLMGLLGGYTYYVDSQWGRTYGIQAFTGEPGPSTGLLYLAYLVVSFPHYPAPGDEVGGAIFPTFATPSDIVSPEFGNWLVRPHDYILPTLAPLPDKTILWPPSHQMVTVSIAANASDNSDRPVMLAATVSSNEPENGLGDGDTAPDWTTPSIDQKKGVITLQLRAERSGRGNGRVYTVTITATDESGNTAQADVDIIVPRDKGKK
jgi:hypothetical protein